MVGDACQYEADNREPDDGEPEKVVVIDDPYLDTRASTARERVAMAGVRLETLLNQALGDQAPEAISGELAALRDSRSNGRAM